ncbi:MAG: DNA polymerase III subunit epsilon [Candidatus Competibacterales bacterium]
MNRQIVLDTETTGLETAQNHRIIEIGAVEIRHRRLTERRFHVYLNPERPVDEGAVAVHGLDDAFLADKPRFADIAQDFVDFIRGAELIIHNAAFDVGFLNAELARWSTPTTVETLCTVVDSLGLARQRHPGQRNTLDALCKRYSVDNRQRTLHGALLDAELLADVYLAMTGGQVALTLVDTSGSNGLDTQAAEGLVAKPPLPRRRRQLRIVAATAQEQQTHQHYLDRLAAAGRCVWRETEGPS